MCSTPRGPPGDISHHYEVGDQNWGKFQTFVELSESALKAVVAWRSFITATTHYLIGTFAPGDPFRSWDTSQVLSHMEIGVDNQATLELAVGYESENREDVEENVLLRYVMALEALLSQDKRTRLEKIATCASFLVGRNDNERRVIRRLVVDSYDIRNALVHGAQVNKKIPPFLNSLRRLCQRTLALTLLLTAEGWQKEADFREMLRGITASHESMGHVESARRRLFSMIADTGPIDHSQRTRGAGSSTALSSKRYTSSMRAAAGRHGSSDEVHNVLKPMSGRGIPHALDTRNSFQYCFSAD